MKYKMNKLEKYINACPKEMQVRLNHILKVVRKAAPNAEEGLKYGKPALFYKRIIVVFSEFKNHIGFYPTPEVVEKFSEELKDYKTSKGAVQFPHDKPLPLKLIEKMTKYRVELYKEEDAKWKKK